MKDSALVWLREWAKFSRPIQKKMVAAVLVNSCEEYYFEPPGRLPLKPVERRIIREALEEIARQEELFDPLRRPNRAELSFGLELALREELERELKGWDLPF